MVTITYDDYNEDNHVAEFMTINTNPSELVLRINNPIYFCAVGEYMEINGTTYIIAEIIHFPSEFKTLYSIY